MCTVERGMAQFRATASPPIEISFGAGLALMFTSISQTAQTAFAVVGPLGQKRLSLWPRLRADSRAKRLSFCNVIDITQYITL